MKVNGKRPSEVFLALWRDRTVKNTPDMEEFAALAEVWQQIRALEEIAARDRRQQVGIPLEEIAFTSSAPGGAPPAPLSVGFADISPRRGESSPQGEGAEAEDLTPAAQDDRKKAARDGKTAVSDLDAPEAPHPSAAPTPSAPVILSETKNLKDPSPAAQDDKAPGALEGFAPVEAPKISGPWSSYKNEILDRLERARREGGVKLADVVKASGGALTDGQLLNMISRSRTPMAKWDVLSAALVKLGWPTPEGSP